MADFWTGKKVLLTGHTGFVGSWLSCVLERKGARVTGFSLEEEQGSLFARIRDRLDIESIYGDLRETDRIRQTVRICDPEIVFHLAAFGFVRECLEDPQRAYTCNVLGTANLLHALRELDHPVRIIIASSDKVYQNPGLTSHLFSEEDPLGGSDPYSASKACEDMIARSYYESYLSGKGDAMCVVRPGNILGGGDHILSRLIPGIYHCLSLGELPVLRNPDSVRPWQHILDMTDAYITLAECCDTGLSVYNVGPEQGDIKCAGEIADYVLQLFGMDAGQRIRAQSEQNGMEKQYLGLSIDRIRAQIGWKPQKTLEQTLDDIYQFHIEADGQNTYRICMKQIDSYYHT